MKLEATLPTESVVGVAQPRLVGLLDSLEFMEMSAFGEDWVDLMYKRPVGRYERKRVYWGVKVLEISPK